MNDSFVTGTDTNVGKTVLSALLVAALDAMYWKPVQTGAVEGTDRESVRAWAGVPEERLLPERYRSILPCRRTWRRARREFALRSMRLKFRTRGRRGHGLSKAQAA